MTAPWHGCQFWLNDVTQHDRIFETLRRYSDDRVAQAYLWLLLAPILPLLTLRRYLKVFLREHLLHNTGTRPAAERRAASLITQTGS